MFNKPPQVIAHRGGAGEAPENTLYAIRLALSRSADILWLSVQVTSDGVPILYRPRDLSTLTDGCGVVGETPLSGIRRLNAGYHFKQILSDGEVLFPFRCYPIPIPTLREALDVIPPNTPIFLDLKSLPASRLVDAIAKVLRDANAWNRVRMYSTDRSHQLAWKAYPQAQLFEDRDTTRQRLIDLMLGNESSIPPPPPGTWVGIEATRPVEVVEYFTLGRGVSKSVAHWWTPDAVKYFRKLGHVNIVLFGINTKDSYQRAKQLDVDAIMTDFPNRLHSLTRDISLIE